ANRYQNIFVVGDDFQSIYSFRGAKIENINRFIEDFKGKLILLEKNYRSTTQILNLANEVIKHNPNQIKKVMYSNHKEGAYPFYYQASSERAEAQFVVDKIKKYYLNGDSYRDFAVMYRTNSISRVFEDTLIKHQIPYVIYGGLSFFARKEIKNMVAYLRVLVNPKDDFSFIRIVNEPKRKIGSTLLERLTMHATENQLSLFEAIPSFEASGVGVKALKAFYQMMISIQEQLNNMPLKNIIDVLLSETGYKDMLALEDPDHERIGNVYELKNVLKETDETVEGDAFTKLESLLYDLSLRTDNENNEQVDAVILSTFHQVKGLEFKNVFMVAMEEGIFPSEYHIEDLDIEEERRICYVGVTRAKERLYLTSAATRMLYGQRSFASPSRFIKEMGSDCLKNVTAELERKKKFVYQEAKPVIENKNKEEYSTGDKVMHNVFGKGIIVSIDEASIKVAFSAPTGVKVLLKDHPSYHKI
ncbi:MAG: ATP-binding domain-containing protein, partial [Anaeroplasmataceae bacterium]|nr:ATP-binding domain-containing protein [Anaeroplasmataceae bacterium]